MKRNPLNAGANQERTAIIAKVRREMKWEDAHGYYWIDGDKLLAWLLKRHDRYNRRKGGVGR